MVIKPVVQWKPWPIRLIGFFLFWPLQLIAFCVFFLRAVFRPRKPIEVPAFVVSVGSLSVGGSGKTPLVQFLAEKLFRKGFRVGVVTTGYRKKSKGTVLVSDGKNILSTLADAGDESYLLARNLPGVRIAAGMDRVDAARLLLDSGPLDVVLLDNGAQYHRLAKNIEILVTDRLEHQFKQLSLPVGRLKDCRTLGHGASVRILTRCRPDDWPISRVSPSTTVFTSSYKPSSLRHWFDGRAAVPLSAMHRKKVILFSGLGLNESFRNQLLPIFEQFQTELVRCKEFNDHHWYTRGDIRELFMDVKGDPDAFIVLTTQKDALKIKMEWVPNPLRHITYFVFSEFVLHSEQDFMDTVFRENKQWTNEVKKR